MTASIIGINRLRIGTDGRGITTLVAFHGCSLECQYCLNPQCKNPDAKTKKMTSREVMQVLRKDELYYIATKGGVTFGGGEPFLNCLFIKSLNVPRKHIEPLLPYIDEFIVDVKDMDNTIYQRYTKRSNEMVKSNLKWLIDSGYSNNISCRIPLIPGYNDEKQQYRSKEELTKMGIKRFDLFTYKTDEK